MSEKIYTQDEVVAYLEKQKGTKTLDEFAEELGISRQTLWYVLKQKQRPNKKVGFERVGTFHTFRKIAAEK